MGRYDEAFPELATAAKSNRVFLPRLIDLAWGLSKEDPKITEQLAGINDSIERTALARFLAKRGKGKETVEQFRFVKTQISEDHKRELVRELVSFRAYRDAYQIWAGTESGSESPTVIYDGGFEGPINFGEVGFGWIVPRDQPRIIASIDTSDKDSGDKSLRIVFDGNSNPTAFVVSQMIIVQPQHRYRINFAVKAKDIVTGGFPRLSLIDGITGLALEGSSTLLLNSTGWEKRIIEFTTPEGSEAVVLKLVRDECQTPCPIFGVLWLDSLSIEDLQH